MLSGLFFLQQDVSNFTSVHRAEYMLHLCSDLYSHGGFQRQHSKRHYQSPQEQPDVLHSAFTEGGGFVTRFMLMTLLCVQLQQMQKRNKFVQIVLIF
jgi:hypothetical protein